MKPFPIIPRRSSRRASASRTNINNHGLSLIELVVATFIFSLAALGLSAITIQSRRMAEENILYNAATTVVYGIVDQLKSKPITAVSKSAFDSTAKAGETTDLPVIKVGLNAATFSGSSEYSLTTIQDTTPIAADIAGMLAGTVAMPTTGENILPEMALSQPGYSPSQPLNLRLWVWVQDYAPITEVRRGCMVTIIYSYRVNTGRGFVDKRDTVRFFLTRFDVR